MTPHIGWVRCLNTQPDRQYEPGTLGAVSDDDLERVKEKAIERHAERHPGCEGPIELMVQRDSKVVFETNDLVLGLRIAELKGR